jgi:hypothetical protein
MEIDTVRAADSRRANQAGERRELHSGRQESDPVMERQDFNELAVC